MESLYDLMHFIIYLVTRPWFIKKKKKRKKKEEKKRRYNGIQWLYILHFLHPYLIYIKTLGY